MKRFSLTAAAVLLSLFGAAPGWASVPVVGVDWLLANGASEGRAIVDLRDKRSYLGAHIPGAVHTDYGLDGWRVRRGGVDGLMPVAGKALDRLTGVIGKLGIDGSTHVVLVAPGWGPGDLGIATRLYWTFKVLGHDEVSILDGGMMAYVAETKADRRTPVNPLERGNIRRTPKRFEAKLRREMLVGRSEIEAALTNALPVLDARPNLQYLGLQKSPSVQRAGTLPGALSLPGEWMTENGGGTIRRKGALAKLFDIAGAKSEGEMFTFCNTGHWASVTWFVAHEILGRSRTKMYDGSLADWTSRRDAPVERKIRLN